MGMITREKFEEIKSRQLEYESAYEKYKPHFEPKPPNIVWRVLNEALPVIMIAGSILILIFFAAFILYYVESAYGTTEDGGTGAGSCPSHWCDEPWGYLPDGGMRECGIGHSADGYYYFSNGEMSGWKTHKGGHIRWSGLVKVKTGGGLRTTFVNLDINGTDGLPTAHATIGCGFEDSPPRIECSYWGDDGTVSGWLDKGDPVTNAWPCTGGGFDWNCPVDIAFAPVEFGRVEMYSSRQLCTFIGSQPCYDELRHYECIASMPGSCFAAPAWAVGFAWFFPIGVGMIWGARRWIK